MFIGSALSCKPEPETVFYQQHLCFVGKRICLGESLARMELFLFLVGLVSQFRFYFPSDKPKPSLEPVCGITNAPKPYQICVEMRNNN